MAGAWQRVGAGVGDRASGRPAYLSRPAEAQADLAAALRQPPKPTSGSSWTSAATGAATARCWISIFITPRTGPSWSRTSSGPRQCWTYGREPGYRGEVGIPVTTGVPALAVLSDTGKLLYGQRGGEFKPMRRMESSAVTKFLVQWRAPKAGCSVMVVNC